MSRIPLSTSQRIANDRKALDLHQRVVALRVSHGVSQEEIAERIGISRVQLHNYLTAKKRNPERLRTIETVVEAILREPGLRQSSLDEMAAALEEDPQPS